MLRTEDVCLTTNSKPPISSALQIEDVDSLPAMLKTNNPDTLFIGRGEKRLCPFFRTERTKIRTKQTLRELQRTMKIFADECKSETTLDLMIIVLPLGKQEPAQPEMNSYELISYCTHPKLGSLIVTKEKKMRLDDLKSKVRGQLR